MKTLKLNFTIPEDVVEGLRTRVGKRGRSAFVAAAVRDRLKMLEKEQLRQSLVEGYAARRSEDAAIDRDWEKASLEDWPR